MTYKEFRKAHPARRIFMRYTPEQRADHASSHRLGRRQREAVGEFFYEHDMIPDRAFPTAKTATTRAYAVYLQGARVAALSLRIEPIADEIAAEDEALAVEQSASDRAATAT